MKASRLVRRPVGPLIFVLCEPLSQEQKSGIFPRDLTTLEGLPMMAKSSARRRHDRPGMSCGLTSLWPVSPHRGSAGARPQEPEEASRPLSPTQSALVQAARLVAGRHGFRVQSDRLRPRAGPPLDRS